MATLKTREEWLNKMLHAHVAPLLKQHGCIVPKDCKVSVGFPGGGSARKRIGECWPRSRSSIKVNEIFINPIVVDQKVIVATLIHEAIHAADDCKSGHKGAFFRAAKAVGLEGKMTATHAGEELANWITAAIAKMPVFAYGSLDLTGRKKQGIRQRKVICVDCGYTLRTTQKWIDVGLPTCCCGGHMGAC